MGWAGGGRTKNKEMEKKEKITLGVGGVDTKCKGFFLSFFSSFCCCWRPFCLFVYTKSLVLLQQQQNNKVPLVPFFSTAKNFLEL